MWELDENEEVSLIRVQEGLDVEFRDEQEGEWGNGRVVEEGEGDVVEIH